MRNKYRDKLLQMSESQHEAHQRAYLARIRQEAEITAQQLIADRMYIAQRNCLIAKKVIHGQKLVDVGAEYNVTGSAITRMLADYTR